MIENKIKSVKQKFGIVGNSTSLNHAIEVAIQVAPTDMSVFITGESGSGKESFSKIIHSMSLRKHGQFIAVNCGAIFKSILRINHIATACMNNTFWFTSRP